MHLTTRLKIVSPGPALTIENNCSLPQTDFFDSLLSSIHGTQKVITRLLTMSSFSNLLECDSYLRRLFVYSTGLPSRMICPRHYQPTVIACKAWALKNCKGLSTHERMFLKSHSLQKRSSFLCHAGFFGIFRKIYTALGHSCESNHYTNLKETLKGITASMAMSQSLIRTVNGKLVYITKTTDTLTTKMNRLSLDLRIVDRTFAQWQAQLNKFSEQSTCHESILLEFLSKHSNAVNRAFVSLLRLTEIQDVLHQFASLESKTLFGFSHLPPFLHPQILSQLATDVSMTHTAKALDEGFPLFTNPMIESEHKGHYIDAGVLITIPVVPDQNAFCTIEYLAPLKFNVSNKCYTGPVTHNNLVLLTCSDSRHILTTESLNKCYQDDTAFICPTNVLNVATNITWLGFPFTPDTKLTFPRNHVPSDDCAHLHPLLHLGERMFLATTTTNLHLSSGYITTAPLAVYQFPCNETFNGLSSGLGTCPARIKVTVPLATPSLLKFTPWVPVLDNNTTNWFSHTVLDIPPPVSLNKTVLRDLDQTLNTIDGQLTHSLASVEDNIDHIEEQPDTRTTTMGYAALTLSIFSCVTSLVLTYLFFTTVRNGCGMKNGGDTGSGPAEADTCPSCHKQRPAHYVAGTASPLEGEDL